MVATFAAVTTLLTDAKTRPELIAAAQYKNYTGTL